MAKMIYSDVRSKAQLEVCLEHLIVVEGHIVSSAVGPIDARASVEASSRENATVLTKEYIQLYQDLAMAKFRQSIRCAFGQRGWVRLIMANPATATPDGIRIIDSFWGEYPNSVLPELTIYDPTMGAVVGVPRPPPPQYKAPPPAPPAIPYKAPPAHPPVNLSGPPPGLRTREDLIEAQLKEQLPEGIQFEPVD